MRAIGDACTAQERANAIDGYLEIGGMLDAGLMQQVKFDFESLKRATGRVSTSNLPIALITTIDWTYIGSLDSFLGMDREIRSQDEDTEGTVHECECPEPCNCDHENE